MTVFLRTFLNLYVNRKYMKFSLFSQQIDQLKTQKAYLTYFSI